MVLSKRGERKGGKHAKKSDGPYGNGSSSNGPFRERVIRKRIVGRRSGAQARS